MVGYNIHSYDQRKTGGGIMDTLMKPFTVQKYGNEHHGRSLDPKHFMQSFSFLGPGTELKIREKLHDDIPLNDLDNTAKEHDYAYLHEKEEYNKDHDKKKHINSIWTADDKFIERAKNSHDDQVMGKIASNLIATKESLEKNNIMDTKRFSGFGVEEKSDPVAKLREIVQKKYKKEIRQDKQKGGVIALAPIAVAALSAIAGKIAGDLYEFVKKR